MRLADIPEEELEEIRKLIQENYKNYPVTTSPRPDGSRVKTLGDLIEERFGIRLSPTQIYELRKGYRTVKVKLPTDVIRHLEEEYGSLSEGLKAVAKMAERSNAPQHLKPALRALVQKSQNEPISYNEIMETIKGLGYSNPHNVFAELSKLGYVENVNGKYKFMPVAIPWYVRFLGGLI